MHDAAAAHSRDFLPFSRGRNSAPLPVKNSQIFTQYHVCISQLRKVKNIFFFFLLNFETTTTYENNSPYQNDT